LAKLDLPGGRSGADEGESHTAVARSSIGDFPFDV
jgi:hypothetical protein